MSIEDCKIMFFPHISNCNVTFSSGKYQTLVGDYACIYLCISLLHRYICVCIYTYIYIYI